MAVRVELRSGVASKSLSRGSANRDWADVWARRLPDPQGERAARFSFAPELGRRSAQDQSFPSKAAPPSSRRAT